MHRRIAEDHPLLPEETLVEGELLALEDVSIAATTLTRPGRDHGEETTSLELLLQSTLDLARDLEALGLLGLDALGLLLLLLFLSGLGLPPTSQGETVVSLKPLSEGGGVDLHDGRLGEGVRADELVVGGMVDDTDHADLLGDALRSP